MKKLLAIVILLIIHKSYATTAILVVEGKYQNKNLFVQNAFNNNGVGFCAQEIKVNGRITTDETGSSAFEIDLGSLQLKYGENVIVEIVHKEGCTPKVLNMEDLKPKPTFEVLTMNISPTGILKWSTKGESGALPYFVEQYKWNKWVPVGEVDGFGTSDRHEYNFKVTMHSGENKYRVKQKGLNSLIKCSQEVIVRSTVDKPSFAVSKNNEAIDFNTETTYEVFDTYGVAIKKGFGKQVKIDNLGKGKYYLLYDNAMTEFSK